MLGWVSRVSRTKLAACMRCFYVAHRYILSPLPGLLQYKHVHTQSLLSSLLQTMSMGSAILPAFSRRSASLGGGRCPKMATCDYIIRADICVHSRAENTQPQPPGLRLSAPAPSPSPTFHSTSHALFNLEDLSSTSQTFIWPEILMQGLQLFATGTVSPTRLVSRSSRRASMPTRLS